MSSTYDCTDQAVRAEGISAAVRALGERQVVVMPTDTVYGVAADAFSVQAVATLLAAKGRGRSMPPPVLIPRLQTMDGLAVDVDPAARRLAEAFWPGGLTLILHSQPSLTWDLGETLGTVALRMPDDPIALEILGQTGPLAVSSANRTGRPAALTMEDARDQLGEAVAVYLDGGPRNGTTAESNLPSTIVDATGPVPRVVRSGSISLERLQDVVPEVQAVESAGPEDMDSENVDSEDS